MKSSKAWMSVTAVASLGIALSGGACSGKAGPASGGAGDDGGTEQDSTGGGGNACTTNADCASQVPPTTPPGCAVGKCDALQGTCSFVAKDSDGDGDPTADCKSNNGVAVKDGGDCNDDDPNIYSGHPEACNEVPDGGTAASPCSAGTKSCMADGTESACTGTLVCTDQACVAGKCAGTCQPGQTQCSSTADAVQTCQPDGTWSTTQSCTNQACVQAPGGGASCQGTCAPGQAPQCGSGSSSNYVQTCDSGGNWENSPTPCPSICTSGACTGKCLPGATGCNNTTPQTCDSSGAWVNDPVTAGKCGAACTPPSQTECIGAVPQTCNAAGTWVGGAVTAGQCGAACTPPNQTECIGTVPQTCNGSGAWVAGSVTAGQCNAACTPGQQTTGCTLSGECGSGVETCSGSGAWGTCVGPQPVSKQVDGALDQAGVATITFTDSTAQDTQVGFVQPPPASRMPSGGGWTLSFSMTQSGNVDNTHTSADPNGPAGKVECADGSGAQPFGSEDFTSGSSAILCPSGVGVAFYKWTNWGGGCCGGYTRNYNLGTITFDGCP